MTETKPMVRAILALACAAESYGGKLVAIRLTKEAASAISREVNLPLTMIVGVKIEIEPDRYEGPVDLRGGVGWC